MAEPRQIPILAGVYLNAGIDVRVALPVNVMPVAGDNGVSGGFMRPHEGLQLAVTGPGTCRGLFRWEKTGLLYAVCDDRLISIDADHNITTIGLVANGGPVTFTHSFERLAVASGGFLYYWDGTTLVKVTDPLIGTVLDVEWIGGYFVTTDGEFLITTSLLDPTVVRPFDYANPESSPDPVVAVLRTRNEINALGRNTIEVFANVGGDNFPLAPIPGAQVQRGVIGTHACCIFVDGVAFLGSGPNEAPGIYLAGNGGSQKISTFEIDKLLGEFTETQLAEAVLEARVDAGHQLLYVHLPDRTLVFDAATTQAFSRPVWFALTSALAGFAQYKARYFTWCFDRWYCADPTSNKIGYLDDSVSTQWGVDVRHEVSTTMIYTSGVGGIIDTLELVAVPGRVPVGAQPTISTSRSTNGTTWSLDETISAGLVGDARKRLQWRRQGRWQNYRLQRFRWDSTAHLSILRLEAMLSPLDH